MKSIIITLLAVILTSVALWFSFPASMDGLTQIPCNCNLTKYIEEKLVYKTCCDYGCIYQTTDSWSYFQNLPGNFQCYYYDYSYSTQMHVTYTEYNTIIDIIVLIAYQLLYQLIVHLFVYYRKKYNIITRTYEHKYELLQSSGSCIASSFLLYRFRMDQYDYIEIPFYIPFPQMIVGLLILFLSYKYGFIKNNQVQQNIQINNMTPDGVS